MRILACGSRTFTDGRAVSAGLFGWSALRGDDPDVIVIEGGASGADALAGDWARRFASEHLQFRADWRRDGKVAGFIRNHRMLEEGRPDVVLAFVDKPLPASRGTAHMVDLARKAGIPVYVTETA